MSAPVMALAGRRPDPPDAKSSSFALTGVPVVATRLRALMNDLRPSAVVSSAACGADLLGLQIAGELGIRRRVVLPFDASRFRTTSVVDRPDERWGPIYDQVLAEVRAANDLVIVPSGDDPDSAYAAANRTILDEAQDIADSDSAHIAVIVWEGARESGNDLTRDFALEAQRRGFEVRPVSTRRHTAASSAAVSPSREGDRLS